MKVARPERFGRLIPDPSSGDFVSSPPPWLEAAAHARTSQRGARPRFGLGDCLDARTHLVKRRLVRTLATRPVAPCPRAFCGRHNILCGRIIAHGELSRAEAL